MADGQLKLGGMPARSTDGGGQSNLGAGWGSDEHQGLVDDVLAVLELARELRRMVILVPSKDVCREAAPNRLRHVGYRRMAVSAVGRLERAAEDAILLLAAAEADWQRTPPEGANDPRFLSWLKGIV